MHIHQISNNFRRIKPSVDLYELRFFMIWGLDIFTTERLLAIPCPTSLSLSKLIRINCLHYKHFQEKQGGSCIKTLKFGLKIKTTFKIAQDTSTILPLMRVFTKINSPILILPMNSKVLMQQNPNKKRLLLTKSSKENIEENPQPPPLKSGCSHSHTNQRQPRFQSKKSQVSKLPPIAGLSNSRISISLPTNCVRTRRTSSSTSQLLSVCKTKQSSFFGLLKPRGLKIQAIISNFITEMLGREVFHLHFGSYLVQPKTFSRILLFAISSLNNSRNLPNFQRILMDLENYQEMVEKVEKGSFSFEFGVRNNHRLGLDFQTVDERVESESLFRLAMEAEGKVLASRNEQLHWEIKEKRKDLQDIQNNITKCRVEIENLTIQIQRLNSQIMRQNETLFSLKNSIMESNNIIERLQSNKRRYSSFMINFHQNKCNQVAVDTRRLQESLREYAEYLNFHPLGKRPYEKSKFASDLQRMLMSEQQQFCKFIATESLTPEGRLKQTQNFLTKTREEYSSIINELLIVIREKTDFIAKLAAMMEEWQENCAQRREILKELNNILEAQALNLEEAKGYRGQGGGGDRNRYSKLANSEKETKIVTIAERTMAIYQIAASFI